MHPVVVCKHLRDLPDEMTVRHSIVFVSDVVTYDYHAVDFEQAHGYLKDRHLLFLSTEKLFRVLQVVFFFKICEKQDNIENNFR